jgi:predicted amidohydrolase YtcJ
VTAGIVLINADIHTMDMTCPRANAVAVVDGRIAALGTSEAIRAAHPDLRVVDAGGRMVLPGFQDAHVHLMDGGTDLIASAALWEVVSIAELQTAVAAHAARTDLPLVMGAGWQPGTFGDHNLTRTVLDAVVRDRPCIVFDSSFHNACMNSVACQMVGLTKGVADPVNGHFVLDALGEPTGMMHEDAIYWARARLPQITDATYAAGLRAGQAHANRHGITGVLDPQVLDRHIRAYAALEAQGGLTLWVCGAAGVFPADTAEQAVARLTRLRADHPGPDFRVQSAKFFFDGVLENRTAAMIDAYADTVGGNASLMFQPDQIADLFTALDAARFQIHVHVIGDRAVQAALDGFAAAAKSNGRWPSLHQLAHLQVMHPDDFTRIGELGAMANIQPLWARNDPVFPDSTMDMIGQARAKNVYAFRQMLNAGAPYCLSSDWAVSTLNPFEIIETAVTREPTQRMGVAPAFLPAERLTVQEAVLGYTVHAAAACWRGGHTGQLRRGFSGDLIVIDRNILECPAKEISDTQVLLTLFKGQEVYRNPTFEG